jgi:hypothetical protein
MVMVHVLPSADTESQPLQAPTEPVALATPVRVTTVPWVNWSAQVPTGTAMIVPVWGGPGVLVSMMFTEQAMDPGELVTEMTPKTGPQVGLHSTGPPGTVLMDTASDGLLWLFCTQTQLMLSVPSACGV